MKKILAIICSAVIALGVLGGCVYRDPNEDRGQGNQQVLDGIELNIDKDFVGTVKIAAPDVASHKSALTAFITSFNVKYPNINVVPQYIDLNSYKSSIGNAAASAAALNRPGDMYDCFWSSHEYLNEWMSQLDILSPLTALAEADESLDLGSLNGQMVSMCSINGNLYMMPRDYNQVVMYYNKDMFDAARVSYPADEMTGAEFKTMCAQLAANLAQVDKIKNDYDIAYSEAVKYVVDCNIAWSSLDYPLVRSFGGSVVDENGNVTFDSEQTAAAIKYWRDLVYADNGGIKSAIDIASGSSNSGQQFRMQQSPIYFHSRAVMSDLVNEVTIANQTSIGVPNLGVAAMPNFGGTYSVGAGCSGYGMYTDCVNGTATWAFLKHIVSIEGQSAYSETGDCVPVLSSLLTDSSAVWRNCLPEKLKSDFNHDAFVYGMQTGACSVYDFYDYVPFAAQTYVTARIEEAFRSCIMGEMNMFNANLTSAAQKMVNDINQAKGK